MGIKSLGLCNQLQKVITVSRTRKPHSEETKTRMRIAQSKVIRPKKWLLPEQQIVERLLTTSATTRSIALEFGCSDATIKLIFRKNTDKSTRQEARRSKQGATLKRIGAGNPELWRHSNWKGRKHTPEARAKQSERKRGTVHPFARKAAQSARLQGVSLTEWQGFSTTEKDRQRKGAQLKTWRLAVFHRDNYTCLMCGKRGGLLHAHHIRPFSSHEDLRFVVSNGATLCAEPCHKQTIGKEALYEAFLDAAVMSSAA